MARAEPPVGNTHARPCCRYSDVPISWATGRNIGISTPWPIRGGALGSPGPDSCPHGPRRAKLSASDRNIALRMRSAWRYGAIHGEAAPDYGTTSSRRFPTAARQCSHPPLGANAPRVRHQSGISMPGELAATACGKARAQAAMRPPSPGGLTRAAWCGLAVTRARVQHLQEIGIAAPEQRMSPLIEEIKGPRSAHTTPTKARQTPPGSASGPI